MAIFEVGGKDYVTETSVKILIGSIVITFLAISYLWKKPITDFGKISLKLCVLNAAGWLIVLPMSKEGHPPPFLFPALLFWLLNILLLPAAATVLWLSRKDGQERLSYLVVAATYVVINIVLLYILPLVGVIHEWNR